MDDEAHVLLECLAHGLQREEFAMQLTLATATKLANARTSLHKLLVLLGAPEPLDWEVLGRFVSKLRQARWKAKCKFEHLAKELVTCALRT